MKCIFKSHFQFPPSYDFLLALKSSIVYIICSSILHFTCVFNSVIVISLSALGTHCGTNFFAFNSIFLQIFKIVTFIIVVRFVLLVTDHNPGYKS